MDDLPADPPPELPDEDFWAVALLRWLPTAETAEASSEPELPDQPRPALDPGSPWLFG
jgi:hypothetical protein